MAGLKGKSGPPGNMNAFKDGLAAIQKRREESITTGVAHASWRGRSDVAVSVRSRSSSLKSIGLVR
jgi:hypothetical protein